MINEDEIIEIYQEHHLYIEDAYQQFQFYEKNNDDQNELYWWDRWQEALQNFAKAILDKIKEDEK